MSGRPRSSRTTSGRRASQRSRARRAVGCLLDAVAARGQLAHQHRAGLVVVLDDEDRRTAGRTPVDSRSRAGLGGSCGGHRAAAGRCRSPARPARCGAPRPRPPIASTRPRTTARPMPVPSASRRPPGHAIELLEQPRQGVVGTPGPPSSIVSRTRPSSASAARDAERRAGGGVLERVLDRRSSPPRRGRRGRRRTGGAVELDLERPAGRAAARALERPADQVVQLEDVPLGPQRAGLDPAEVEQVGDEPVEVLDLAVDRVGALALASSSSSLSGRSVPAAARIVASGVRRSCDTDWSSADLRASLWRAISAACASAASRSWASAWPIWSAAAASSRVSVRSGSPDRASRSAQIEPSGCRRPRCGRGRPRGRRRPRALRLAGWWTRTHCAGSSPGSAGARGASPGRGRGAAAGVGCDPLARVVRPERDPDRARSRPRAQDRRDLGSTAVVDCARRERPAHPEQRARLALARRAVSARARWSAASWPTTMPTNRSRNRLMSSAGSLIASV